jgi:hypothetical protein
VKTRIKYRLIQGRPIIRQEVMIRKGNRRCKGNGKTEIYGRSYA